MTKKGPNAQWSLADEDALLDYLWDHRAEAGEGMSFKGPTLTAAATKVQVTTMRGGPKTAASCKNKWGKVRNSVVSDLSGSDMAVNQFKELYLIVCDIKAQSGFTWSDEKGADIGPESVSVWDAYVKVSSSSNQACVYISCCINRRSRGLRVSKTRVGVISTKSNG